MFLVLKATAHPFKAGLSTFVVGVQLQHAAEEGQTLAAAGCQPGQPEQGDDIIWIEVAGCLETVTCLGFIAVVRSSQALLQPGSDIICGL